jgi:hypothetical protein
MTEGFRFLRFVAGTSLLAVATLLPTASFGKTACSADLRRTTRAVDRALDQHAASTPFAPESTAAKLHHQPTPSTVARAERRFDDWPNRSEAVRALRRARQANHAGDAQACLAALRDARVAVGIAP